MPIDGPQYPANLVVQGRRCVVVGGGHVAARKAEGLLACGADVVVVAPDVSDDAAALEGPDGIAVVRRRFEPGDLEGAWLVVTATGDPAVDGAVSVPPPSAGSG